MVFLLIGVILHAANPTPGTLITDLPVPLVVEGKTVGSVTLKAGTQVSVISILPNDGGVVISRGEGSPFVVPKTALSKESILLAIATASATPTPSPNPIAVATPAAAATAKPSPTTNSTTNQVGVAAETDFATRIDHGMATITRYTGAGGDVIIPNTILGAPVGAIGFKAFDGSNLTSVVIPDSVTKIERLSFKDCSKLSKIALPKNLVEFKGLGSVSNLKFITIDPGNQNFIVDSEGVLFDTSKNSLLIYPATKKQSHYTIPNTVTEIGNWAFANCKNLQTVELPESLLKIGVDAFGGSSIQRIVIPNSVTTIDNFAFRSCPNLANVSIGSGVTDMGGGVFFGCGKLQKAQFEGNAPAIKGTDTFEGAAGNFKVYYRASAEGFGSPVWVDNGGGRWKTTKFEN